MVKVLSKYNCIISQLTQRTCIHSNMQYSLNYAIDKYNPKVARFKFWKIKISSLK